MKIQDMPAGPEMDRLVAERVMGWREGTSGYRFIHEYGRAVSKLDGHDCDFFCPSSSIADAWEVVERVTDIRLPRRADGFPPSTVFMRHFQKTNLWSMSSEDAALAICRAALLAVGCEVVP